MYKMHVWATDYTNHTHFSPTHIPHIQFLRKFLRKLRVLRKILMNIPCLRVGRKNWDSRKIGVVPLNHQSE